MIKGGVTYMMNPLTSYINYSINLNIKYQCKSAHTRFFYWEKIGVRFFKKTTPLGE